MRTDLQSSGAVRLTRSAIWFSKAAGGANDSKAAARSRHVRSTVGPSAGASVSCLASCAYSSTRSAGSSKALASASAARFAGNGCFNAPVAPSRHLKTCVARLSYVLAVNVAAPVDAPACFAGSVRAQWMGAAWCASMRAASLSRVLRDDEKANFLREAQSRGSRKPAYDGIAYNEAYVSSMSCLSRISRFTTRSRSSISLAFLSCSLVSASSVSARSSSILATSSFEYRARFASSRTVSMSCLSSTSIAALASGAILAPAFAVSASRTRSSSAICACVPGTSAIASARRTQSASASYEGSAPTSSTSLRMTSSRSSRSCSLKRCARARSSSGGRNGKSACRGPSVSSARWISTSSAAASFLRRSHARMAARLRRVCLRRRRYTRPTPRRAPRCATGMIVSSARFLRSSRTRCSAAR
mmetsp:Transcript_10622/g.42963  ORF Transcript_10622/g.42963 Transcript_10622/m.42963 type:complete len:417 (+) Transcript_10622:506-1756(+)